MGDDDQVPVVAPGDTTLPRLAPPCQRTRLRRGGPDRPWRRRAYPRGRVTVHAEPGHVQYGLSFPAPGRALQYVMYRLVPKVSANAPHAPSPVATAGKPASQPAAPTTAAASAAAVTRTRIAMAVEAGDPCGSDEVTSSSPLTGPAEPFTRTTERDGPDGGGTRGLQRQAEV